MASQIHSKLNLEYITNVQYPGLGVMFDYLVDPKTKKGIEIQRIPPPREFFVLLPKDAFKLQENVYKKIDKTEDIWDKEIQEYIKECKGTFGIEQKTVIADKQIFDKLLAKAKKYSDYNRAREQSFYSRLSAMLDKNNYDFLSQQFKKLLGRYASISISEIEEYRRLQEDLDNTVTEITQINK